MTIEFENSKNPIKSWGSKHEEEVAMKMQQKKSTTMDNKPNMISFKRTCICAPTSHEGSFRCHLHRKTATVPKPSLTSPKFGSGPNQTDHQLSRFSKVACTD